MCEKKRTNDGLDQLTGILERDKIKIIKDQRSLKYFKICYSISLQKAW